MMSLHDEQQGHKSDKPSKGKVLGRLAGSPPNSNQIRKSSYGSWNLGFLTLRLRLSSSLLRILLSSQAQVLNPNTEAGTSLWDMKIAFDEVPLNYLPPGADRSHTPSLTHHAFFSHLTASLPSSLPVAHMHTCMHTHIHLPLATPSSDPP